MMSHRGEDDEEGKRDKAPRTREGKIQINQKLCIALPRALAVVARLARSVEARRETAGDIPATISNIHLYNCTRGGLGVRTAPGTFCTLYSTHIPTRTQ